MQEGKIGIWKFSTHIFIYLGFTEKRAGKGEVNFFLSSSDLRRWRAAIV